MRVRRIVLGVCLAACAWLGVSLLRALTADTGESATGKVAAWARNHRLGALVDLAESVRYRKPPSLAPATALPQPRREPSEPPARRAPATTLPALPPVIKPALSKEGVWAISASLRGEPVVWVTRLRPSPRYPSVLATYAVIEQSALRAALFNGTEIPGKGPWRRAAAVPGDLRPALVFAHNGGFRREHTRGGYLTEGREVWPLVPHRASLAIDADGRVRIGTWGEDLAPEGPNGAPWASVRQNLTLILRNGRVPRDIASIQWGSSDKGALFILRSALCERKDGRLMYAIVGPADARVLARSLAAAGCQNAMQLDVNASYPRGYAFRDGEPYPIDARMPSRDDIYLTRSHREFIAFFDRDADSVVDNKALAP